MFSEDKLLTDTYANTATALDEKNNKKPALDESSRTGMDVSFTVFTTLDRKVNECFVDIFPVGHHDLRGYKIK